jgi:hypothetical protein
MTYRVSIGKKYYTCSYGNKALFEYAGVSMKHLNGKLALHAYEHLAGAVVLMHDPRFVHEFLLREQGQGDLDDAKKFLTWLFQACSNEPGEIIDVRFIKEKGFVNPEGV